TAFIIKETPCLQVMLLVCAAVLVVKTVRCKRTGINGSLRENFPLVTSLCWIVGYTFIAVSISNNHGLRHFAPVFPFCHMVVGPRPAGPRQGILVQPCLSILSRSPLRVPATRPTRDGLDRHSCDTPGVRNCHSARPRRLGQ